MKIQYILFILLFIFPISLSCQNRTSNWYFGEGIGLKFDEKGTTVLDDGQTFYQEGVSSISDINGNFLFYTDGEVIWNRTHTVMPNGDGLNGHYSSTQGAMIVKQPGSCNTYYVFTLDGKEHSFVNGLNYHVVDLDLNGGKGDVISKNNQLIGHTAEKLAAVYHEDGESVWIVCHEMNSNKFYAYLLTDSGLDLKPVISATGQSFTSIWHGIGQMKISLKGDRLAYTAFVNNTIELFDFDNSTGGISNPQTIDIAGLDSEGGYGLEFSPNGRFLYATKFNINYLNKPGSLFQFDLHLGSTQQILDNATFIAHNKPPSDMRGMQLAPNGKIYLSNSLSQYLGVINDPDKLGLACNYNNEGQSLNGGYAGWTLPNFVVSYITERPTEVNVQKLQVDGNCSELELKFKYDAEPNSSNLLWDFGDGSISNVDEPIHIYETPGQYQLSLIIYQDCESDTLNKLIEIINCNNKVYIPNAFSPNGDGINDIFQVVGPGIFSIEMEVFDRWGERVFKSEDINHGWDGKLNGKPMNPGLFVYQAFLKFGSGVCQSLSGEVTLVLGK